MPSYRDSPTRADRAKAIAAVVGVHLGIGALVLTSNPALPEAVEQVRTTLVDIAEPPPPPPPPPDPARAREEEGAAGKKAEPTPVVAPKPRIELPTTPPVPAAPVAGTGTNASAGTATSGSGPGAGGSGSGRGGGGPGGSGGMGAEPRLLGGNRARLPRDLLRSFAADRGFAHLWLTLSESGRVSACSAFQSSGNAAVDQALCNVMVNNSRWTPARDTQGRPISVRFRYTATWSKD